MKPYLLFPLLLCGCASIVSGQQQSVSVQTSPVVGASCKLENSKGSWFVNPTPGSTTVKRAYSDMKAICTAQDWYGEHTVASSTKGMVFGNILFGGLIGIGVDVGTGAAFDYPNVISVPMAQRTSVPTIAPNQRSSQYYQQPRRPRYHSYPSGY